jgi:cathepsin L
VYIKKIKKYKYKNNSSCYSFCALAAIESQALIHLNKSLDLSEQQIVDCSADYGNQGCMGGLMTNSFEYLKQAGGAVSEQDYTVNFTFIKK